MIIDLADFSPNQAYHLLTQTVIPRPIAWILSQNADGKTHNLAPFSYFAAVASDPPLLMASFSPKPDGTLKDTVINCQREKKFVIHIPNDEQTLAVQTSAEALDYGESEIPRTGLSLCDFGDTGLQRLSEAPIAFACSLYRQETIGNAPQTLIFAEVNAVYISDTIVSQANERLQVSAEKLAPLSRLGRGQFASLGAIFKPEA